MFTYGYNNNTVYICNCKVSGLISFCYEENNTYEGQQAIGCVPILTRGT